MTPKRMKWRTRYGFYLAAIGSAFGLGNLWRFPYIVSENGGGAFVLLYVLLAMSLGLPILIAELILGQSQRQPVIAATRSLKMREGGRSFRWVGRICFGLALLVLSYYAVISGWVLYFVVQFLSEAFVPRGPDQVMSLSALTDSGFLQIGLASVHLIICTAVIARGVHEGIERWIGSMMPVFGVLLVFLLWQSLSLPTATEAFRFLFYPNFSALTWNSLGHAIGHVCFTLGVGLGTMVTFGSYLLEKKNIPAVGYRVALMDTSFSLIAGLVIIPIALAVSNVPLNDPSLLFQSLPGFLQNRSGGVLFGLGFFVCLYLAALGGSLGLMEVIVSNAKEVFRVSRLFASWLSGSIVLLFSVVPAVLGSMRKEDSSRSVLENLDAILINWLLPLTCLFVCVAIAKGMKRSEIEANFKGEGASAETQSLFSHWYFALKWGIPGLILLGLALQVVGLFR
ncbi:MAG: sodium-dependent transporter [Bdellovibrionaceae bacterium]|nr:sodium-dependent transporter [Pseudobdellovibrionaceae bacterium]